MDSVIISVTATFTAEPLEPALVHCLDNLDLRSDICFAGYNQVFQELLAPESLMTDSSSKLNVVLVRLEDWLRDRKDAPLVQDGKDPLSTLDLDATRQRLEGNLKDLISALQTALSRTTTPFLVGMCPSSPGITEHVDLGGMMKQLEQKLCDAMKDERRLQLITSAQMLSAYSIDPFYDPHGDRYGHMPFTPAFYTALGQLIVRSFHRFHAPPYKVLVLDCDQTVWRGVCGEDGPEGVTVDEGFHYLQTWAVQQATEGMLICLCSKNDEEDVWAVFDGHSDMVLQRQHLSAWRINWQTKSANIQALSEELKLGLDSFIFIDDSPVECAEVAAHCPEVLTLQLPVESDSIPRFLEHTWAFDRLPVTDEDRKRRVFYHQNLQREHLQTETPSFKDFIDRLELQININDVQPDQLPRIAQLTQRTNQFNFTTIRRSESDIETFCRQQDADCLSVEVADRFGDYGLVGAALFETREAALEVDTFLLSCRVLGRGVEDAIIKHLAQIAQTRNLDRVHLTFRKTERNQPALAFLERIGSDHKEEQNGALRFLLTVEHILNLPSFADMTDRAIDPTSQTTAGTDSPSTISLARATALAGFAADMGDPTLLQANLDAQRHPRPDLQQAYVEPRTDLEKGLAAIWAEVLGVEEIGLDDAFADLGGKSLQIVYIHQKIEQKLGLELTLTDLFRFPTIDTLSKHLEQDVDRGEAGDEQRKQAEQLASLARQSRGFSADGGSDGEDALEGIAIVGLSGRFPGADNVDEFWSNLVNGVESVSPLTEEQVRQAEEENPALKDNPDFIKVCSPLKDADCFDTTFFGISPKEAEYMDPQHRVFLECAWHALEDAGCNPDVYRGSVGVYAGCYMNTYLINTLYSNPQFGNGLGNSFQVDSLQTEIGNDKDYLATRISFKLNLRGPSITVQTACSTSLVAIAQACQSLVGHQCDMALAGGVSIRFPQYKGYLYQEGSIASADGHCRAFDSRARGTVFGNGVGVVALKRLKDAVADGDSIYSVIKGWAVNNDGALKASYPAPSVEGQNEVVLRAQTLAGFDPESIQYVEAHGTGTPLGDPIEFAGLAQAFRSGTDRKNFCGLGSVKTNIGHLDIASGVASLCKVAMAFKNGVIPPTLHFEQPNPELNIENSPFYINTTLKPWETEGGPRRAGISSFGVGGTNAHIVLEEAPEVPSEPTRRPHCALVMTAKTADALDDVTIRLAAALKAQPDLELEDVAYTLQTGRKAFNHRRVLVASNLEEAAALLEANDTKRVMTRNQVRRDPDLVFMFPGQGSQHPGMTQDLYQHEPVFAHHLDYCAKVLQTHLGLDLREVLFPDDAGHEEAAEQLKQTAIAQPAIFAVEYALAQLWLSWGVRPQAMIGHSVGEFVAACLAGVFSLEDGLRLLVSRGRLMQDLPSGAMAAVRLTPDALRPMLGPELDIAAVNAPQMCVVSGPDEAMATLKAKLEEKGLPIRTLHTSHAFHSSMMDPVVEPFAAQFDGIELSPPQQPIMSTVSAEWLTDEQATDPYYWSGHLRRTVRFADGIEQLLGTMQGVYLEVGPGQTLSTLVRQHPASGEDCVPVATCPHAQQEMSDNQCIQETLGKLWLTGVKVDWSALYTDQKRCRRHLPLYPFQRKRYWLDLAPSQEAKETLETEAIKPAVQTPANGAATTMSPPSNGTSNGHPSIAAGPSITQDVVRQQIQIMAQQLEIWRQRKA